MRSPIRTAFYRSFAAVVLLTGLLSSIALPRPQGQTEKIQQSMKGAVLKGKAPVSKEVLKVNLPKPEETTLKNGLRVVLLERHKVPTFAMEMVVLSGGLSDPKDLRGVASYTASLLREGTKTKNSKQIAEAVDSVGATLNANSSLASTISTVSASGLTDNFDQVLSLFSDVILNPAFPKDEVEKYKARQLSQLQFIKSLPQFLSISTFRRAIYGDHPAGELFPPKEAIEKITPETLESFHSTYYRPNNAILAVVG
ncbi:MAG: M16 family metallopeptidase, partial [Blastocatellia bacterium]